MWLCHSPIKRWTHTDSPWNWPGPRKPPIISRRWWKWGCVLSKARSEAVLQLLPQSVGSLAFHKFPLGMLPVRIHLSCFEKPQSPGEVQVLIATVFAEQTSGLSQPWHQTRVKEPWDASVPQLPGTLLDVSVCSSGPKPFPSYWLIESRDCVTLLFA